jgi:hypothetical protein
MTPLSDVMREYAFSDPKESAAHTMAEHVAIGARIADWHNLNKRIEFLTMIAAAITFLGVLRNEGVTLTLTPEGKFLSTPREIDPQIKSWIMLHRDAIKSELEETRE